LNSSPNWSQGLPKFDEFFAIFQNLACNISLIYKVNELKLCSLLEPLLCSEYENFVAVARLVRVGGAPKFANFETVRLFGAT